MRKLTILVLLVCALAPADALAQARRIAPPAPVDERTAPALYDDASGYAARKFQEFAAKKMPFDPKLLEKTLQEQKELAARHAALLNARPNLAGDDLYFLGLLYNLSANEERTVETLKSYLTGERATIGGERPQYARYLVALRAAKDNRLEESEAMLAAYLRLEPRKPTEQVMLENALTDAYRKQKQLERALPHAEEAYKTARAHQAAAKKPDADRLLYISSNALVDIYQELKKPVAETTALLEEVRKQAIATPSPRLYTDATEKLADVLVEGKRKPEAVKMIAAAISYAETGVKPEERRYVLRMLQRKQRQLRLQGEAAPEIKIAKWVEQSPLKLSDLRGRVVLLDFWATWCGPCLAAFPHLREWHEKYKDRGLVVLGITKYYGQGNGQEMTPAEELLFIEQFKKSHNLPYGVAVTDTDDNHLKYEISAIPTAILIDRQGVIRLLSTGVGGGNEAEISEAIEKLLAEQ